MSPDQITQLGTIGFWLPSKYELRWMEQYRRLEAYVRKHGHANVPIGDPEHSLAVWVHTQRQCRKGQTPRAPLTPEKLALLEKLSFRWSLRGGFSEEVFENAWKSQFARLQQFKVVHGHTDVPKGWVQNPTLANWVRAQRRLHQCGKLSFQRIERLTQLGFQWQIHGEAGWAKRLAEVTAFKARHGHCDIPQIHPPNIRLGRFVHHVRRLRKHGSLSTERIAQLDALGFTWQRQRKVQAPKPLPLCESPVLPQPPQPRQPKRADFTALNEGRASVGNRSATPSARAPTKTPDGRSIPRNIQSITPVPPIHASVDTQTYWQGRFKELLAYKELYRDCDVPANWAINKPLAIWVREQRKAKRAGMLPADQTQLLDEAGFLWRV
jgi:hypothetical protein